MFEARLVEGQIMKLIIEAVKDLVVDANLDCGEEELTVQCMDSAHVSLVAIQLAASAFDLYRCDRPLSLGVNTGNMAKIFKMMNKDDVLVMKAEDEPETLSLMFEGGEKNTTVADFGTYRRSPPTLHYDLLCAMQPIGVSHTKCKLST